MASKEKPKWGFAMKIPNTPEGQECLRLVRKFANRDRYELRAYFDGPRKRFAATTLKKNATGFRVYFRDKDEHNAWYWKNIRDLCKKLKAIRDLAHP